MKLQRTLLLVVTTLSLLLQGCGATKGKEAAEQAVVRFHEQLDQGGFAAIYSAAHPDFREAATAEEFSGLLEAIHRKLGTVRSTTQARWTVGTFNFATQVVLIYDTEFAEGAAVETFTYRIESGEALLISYNINSNALITK